MVAIHLVANYIFNEPMKNRTEGQMMAAYQKIINRMRAAGLGLQKHILDNEASDAFKEKFGKKAWSTNSSPREITGGTRQSGPSKLLKHTSSQFLGSANREPSPSDSGSTITLTQSSNTTSIQYI
jgi:hypothetical protein